MIYLLKNDLWDPYDLDNEAELKRRRIYISGTSVISEGVYIADGAVIGDETYVGGGAYIGVNVFIGPRAVISRGAFISRRSSIHEGVYIGNGVLISDDVSIGLDSDINDRVVIGHGSIIGAEVVIPPNMIIGAYARILEKSVSPVICIAGSRFPVSYWGEDRIDIGNESKSIAGWLVDFTDYAKRHDFTIDQAREYMGYVEFIAGLYKAGGRLRGTSDK